MARLSTALNLLVTVLLVAALFGCVTSDSPTTDEAERLDRWIEGGSEESRDAAAAVPERDATPPRRVALESLQTDEAPLHTISDLPRPEYFSFELPDVAYVSVEVQSEAGTAISLIDRSVGAFAEAGRAGDSDGRIDTLLDKGEYRVRVQTVHEDDEATVSVHEFTDVQTDTGLLMNSAPGTLHESTLRDYEQRSYWVRVTEDEPLIVEAMGRALRAVRVWKDGVWVTSRPAQVSEYSPVTGRRMGYAQLSEQLEPGNYLLTFYGGAAREWEEESAGNPFYVRRGAKYLGSVVDAQTEISPMGRDAFLVSGDVTVLEIENPDFVPVRLGVASFGPGQDRYRAISTISLDRSGESTRSRGTVSRSSSMRWIFVAGTPGDTVRIRAIPQRTEYEIDEPTPGSQYLISTVSTLDSDHAIDATPIIVREGTRTSRDEVIRSEALAVTDTPLVREINLFQPLFFIVDLDRSGQWAIVHDRPDDSPVAIGMIPFRDLHDIVTPHVVADNPASFDVEAGQHMVLFQPYTPGVFQFALYYRGDASAANDRRAADLLKSSAPKPREDITYVTSPNEIMAGRDHMVLANNRGGPMTALFAQRLPLNLEEEVPLTLSPGETLSIPVSPTTPGAISTGYSSIELRLGGRLLNSGQVIPVGRSTLTVTNTGSFTTTFVLRLDPTFVPSFTAPAIPAIEEALPILTPGPAVYHDYERDHARQFLLVVDEPAFYELQTTGRLATRISTRTPANPNGFSAEGNGPGRNALVQAYFRPGTYLVDVKPQGSSEGRAGLVISPLPMENLGRLSEGAWYRTELDPGVGLKGTIGVQTAGRFTLRTIGLYGSPTTRLEDADAWPLEGTLLGPGVYTYVSWPQTVWSRRLTGYFRQTDATVFAEDEAWQLNLNESHRRTWNETPGRTPHLFQVDSPATVPVTLRTSSRMEWWVIDEEDLPVFEGQGAETFDLPAGRNTIRIRSHEENNNVGYEISLSTAVLADGLERQIQRVPTGIPVVVEQSGVYEFWSTGTRDVRATLRTKDGELPLAEGDDRPGDWNFHISRYLPSDEYVLNVTESFPGSGTVTIACQLRDEVWVDPQDFPLDTRIQLDRAIVGIPFRTDRSDAPIRITADSSAAHLALYRDETLIAEGRDALFVPLLGDREYLLRIRNDSLTATAVGLQVAAADAQRLEWAGVEPLQLPPGAATITNRTAISVIAPAQRHPPLLSGAFEQPALELGGGVLANPGGTIWSWYDGNQPVQVQPFVMKPGPARAFDITDDDVSMWVISPSGTVSVLEARTMAGHLGVKAVGSSSDGTARDWAVADMELSSTIIGFSGARDRQVWLWDGEPRSAGRRVELVLREFSVDGEFSVTGQDTYSVSPGGAIAVSTADATAVQILLSPDLVAFSVNNDETVRTVASRNENRSADMPGGGVIYLVNTGRREQSARILAAPAQEVLQVTRTSGMETILPKPGIVTARIRPGRTSESTLAVWAVQPSEILLLTDSGRRIAARPPDGSAPYWSLPGVSGQLRVTALDGPVAAWLQQDAEGSVAWAAQRAGRTVPLAEGENIMTTTPQRWQFVLDQEAFIMATTDNRGVTILDPGGAQEVLPPQLAIGSGDHRRVFAVLGPGTHTLITRPLADEPQPAPLKFQILDPIPISELIDPVPLFLSAGDRVVFELNVRDDAAVGIGLRAETDDFMTYLLDDQLRVVGTGRIYYRELAAGRYYLLAENGDLPMNVVPVILADQGSRTGVPEQVIESYRGN